MSDRSANDGAMLSHPMRAGDGSSRAGAEYHLAVEVARSLSGVAEPVPSCGEGTTPGQRPAKLLDVRGETGSRAIERASRRLALASAVCLLLGGCGTLGRLSDVGRPPEMTPTADPIKEATWRPVSMPMPSPQIPPNEANSLWRQGSRAFFKDQRAAQVGDVVTIIVSMNDTANLKNVTSADRTSKESAGMPNLFGLESLLPKTIADPSKLLSASSGNNNTGTGQIQRNEAVTLRLAGVVTQVLPNGNLVVAARQEFLVNSELRQLQVTGVIRPQDIASNNTVLHDRMAEARIAYGGRGQLTDVQNARWGQQIMDVLLPF
jgi:flagellar L-ring protein precursor FlgH